MSSSKFEKGWKTQEKEPFGKQVRDTVRGPKPMRPQIQKATQQLTGEITRLDQAMNRLRQRECSIF